MSVAKKTMTKHDYTSFIANIIMWYNGEHHWRMLKEELTSGQLAELCSSLKCTHKDLENARPLIGDVIHRLADLIEISG